MTKRKPQEVPPNHMGIDSKLKKEFPHAIAFRVDRLRRVFPIHYIPSYDRATVRAMLRKAGQGYKARTAAFRRAQNLAAGLPA